MSLLEDLHEGYLLQNADKEKEPATDATVTDSVDVKTGVLNSVSISKYTTDSQKSQDVLKSIARELLQFYNRLDESHQHAWELGEIFAKVREGIEE